MMPLLFLIVFPFLFLFIFLSFVIVPIFPLLRLNFLVFGGFKFLLLLPGPLCFIIFGIFCLGFLKLFLLSFLSKWLLLLRVLGFPIVDEDANLESILFVDFFLDKLYQVFLAFKEDQIAVLFKFLHSRYKLAFFHCLKFFLIETPHHL